MVATWRIILSTTAFVVPVTVTSLDAFGYVARVEGASMQPSLNPKETSGTDYVYLNRWAAKDFRFRRGDVVSLASPMNPEQKLIKRIIGMEGDVVRTLSYKNRYVKIPPGHCWVEGDHTGQSLDSNLFGPIAMGLITAKASAVVWPPKRMHLLASVTPSNSRVRINPEVVMATRAPATETSTLTVEDMA